MSAWSIAELFFLQAMVIMIVSRILSLLGRKIFQPVVVCEMITGVLLGPSLLGAIFPELFNSLFPKDSMNVIFTFAQLGLSLYMFTVGLEFDLNLFRKKSKQAITISAAGILIPFTLAAPITFFFLNSDDFFNTSLNIYFRWLFVGAAISITAFPMLARIIKECNLSETKIGTVVLSAAAGDDVLSWCFLAFITASIKGTFLSFLVTVLGGLAYAFFCFYVVAPIIGRLASRFGNVKNDFTEYFYVFILSLLMFGSWFTDKIGIYSVFGAFVLGLSLPKGIYKHELDKMITPLTTFVLLPMFFVYSGLNARMDMIFESQTLLVAAVVIIGSIIAKGIGCGLFAKFTGENIANSFAIGALMNARGLMELILLNIGLQNNIITVKTYTVFVLMAIVTTFMASPVFFYMRSRGIKLD
jgi:Kef-type K+ transport system membrane component KefB